MVYLTKSKYMVGLQCPKYLWMMFNEPDKIPKFDSAMIFLFNQGHNVGDLAKKIFPGGVDVPESDFVKNLELTSELIKERKTIFEAGIKSGDLYARADVLLPADNNSWDVIEVKASTKVKEEHIQDLSFQKYVYELAGLKIRNCFLMHINNQFVKDGEINPNDILTKEDITADVVSAMDGIKERIDEMLRVIKLAKPPKSDIRHCEGSTCCFSAECLSFLPEENVLDLYIGGKKSFELLEADIFAIKNIPDEFKLTEKQDIQRNCAKSGKIHVDVKGLKKFLDKLQQPISYLDFETFYTAIPIYEGTKPYQQIPFQFSLLTSEGTKLNRSEFLHDSKEDPREPFIRALKKSLPDEGSIVVYNQSFEIGRLNEIAKAVPEYADWIESIIVRIVDLIVPFRKFHYYNPKQKGSCGLKDVLPAITGQSYEDLEIGSGGLASVSYYDSVFGNPSPEHLKEIRDNLLKYCAMDTEAMIWIIEALQTMSGS
ncbi:DUF2779 domain-containing protein [Nanoarchaeota archaeon]